MKKTVLILLAAFLLCTLIIFSTACENRQEQPMMQIELAVNSACRVENAAGQSLTFRNGAWEGDMAASGVSMNGFDDTTMTLEIPYTEALHYTHESGESRFSVLRGQESILLSGDGIDEARVTQDSLTVTGSGMQSLGASRKGVHWLFRAVRPGSFLCISRIAAAPCRAMLRLPMP